MFKFFGLEITRQVILIPIIYIMLLSSSCNEKTEGVVKEDEQSPVKETPYVPIEPVVSEKISDSTLLDLIQSQTLKYFTDFAEPKSGMARERNTSGSLVTTGGTGFGIMSIIVGVERGWIEREKAVKQILKIENFLNKVERFHGAWSHWIDADKEKAFSFSKFDNGGDLIETAFLVQGMIAAREYFDRDNQLEDSLRVLSDKLWKGVEWDWYTKNGAEKALFWHWSKDYEWKMNMKIKGWNEGLIAYVLGASSPTFPISKQVYDQGWASNGGMKNGKKYFDQVLPLGFEYGGPLFFSHYSFLGLDPRGLSDKYANYFEQNYSHSIINYRYCVNNPKSYKAYSKDCWGLTASDEKGGYSAHAPYNYAGKDNGTITPTAALSSMPYTPIESLQAARFFYYYLKDKLWGNYGFKDAFNPTQNWTANSYLAIDQGPIVVMIENYRSGLIWKYFMKNKDIQNGLKVLDFKLDNNK
jgi:hypothetical protein